MTCMHLAHSPPSMSADSNFSAATSMKTIFRCSLPTHVAFLTPGPAASQGLRLQINFGSFGSFFPAITACVTNNTRRLKNERMSHSMTYHRCGLLPNRCLVTRTEQLIRTAACLARTGFSLFQRPAQCEIKNSSNVLSCESEPCCYSKAIV